MRRGRRILAVVVLQLLLGALAVAFLPGDDSDDKDRVGGGAEQPELSGNQALLAGVVTDQESKKPIGGAVIRIDHEAGPTTLRSGADGRFRAVVDTSRPIGFTIDAPHHKGVVSFGKLCAKERRQLHIALPSATSPAAPPAPLVLEENCP